VTEPALKQKESDALAAPLEEVSIQAGKPVPGYEMQEKEWPLKPLAEMPRYRHYHRPIDS